MLRELSVTELSLAVGGDGFGDGACAMAAEMAQTNNTNNSSGDSDQQSLGFAGTLGADLLNAMGGCNTPDPMGFGPGNMGTGTYGSPDYSPASPDFFK